MRTPLPLALTLAGALVAPGLLLTPATAGESDPADLVGLAELAALVQQTATDGRGAEASQDVTQRRAERRAQRLAERRAERRAQRLAEAAEPGLRGATPIKAGWWWLVNEPPEEAETGLLAFPTPPTPTVPAGTLPVAAVLGEAEKVSAIEIALDEPDRAVEKLVLGLQEAEEPQANPGSSEGLVLACQVTEAFWADGQAARWRSRPAYDCDKGAAQGSRDDSGRWVFDLTPLARSWTGEGALSNSVVLVEGADAPGSFQVAFQGISSESLGLTAVFGDLVVTPGDDEQPAPAPGDDAGSSSSGSGSGGSSGPVSSGGGLDSGSSGDLGSAPATGSDPAAADGSAGATGDVTAPAIETRAVALPSWYDGIPAGGLLMVPIALLTAFLAMLALGPDGRPVPGHPQRGVSLALERLRASRSRSDA